MFGAALRTAFGSTTPRGLRNGGPLPVREAFSHGGGNLDTFTVTKPAGTVTGDLLVWAITRIGSSACNLVGGSVDSVLWDVPIVEGARSTRHYGYSRIVQGGDTDWDFDNIGGFVSTGWVCYRISGHDPAAPIADFSTEAQSGTTSSIIIPAVLSDITNCLLLHLVAKSDVLSGTITPPGDAETVDVNDDHSDIQHLGAWENHAAGGGTGTRTYGMSHTVESNFGALVLIQPSEAA